MEEDEANIKATTRGRQITRQRTMQEEKKDEIGLRSIMIILVYAQMTGHDQQQEESQKQSVIIVLVAVIILEIHRTVPFDSRDHGWSVMNGIKRIEVKQSREEVMRNGTTKLTFPFYGHILSFYIQTLVLFMSVLRRCT